MPFSPLSRRQLAHASLASAAATCLPGAARGANAVSHTALAFPRDAGAHPDFQTEWWYVTGYANVAGQVAALGFQITFFRRRVASTQGLNSALAAKQLLFAHAAVSDVAGKVLWSDQRIARWSGTPGGANPADGAWARMDDTGVVLRDWSLLRTPEGALRAQVRAADFALDLRFTDTQPLLLQGEQGRSRKGPDAAQFSYYYSRPQLQTQGEISVKGKRKVLDASSRAWLDQEWSDALLHPDAVGWDWIGINLLNGSALTAFRLRRKDGSALWDGGSFRQGELTVGFKPGEVVFEPERQWRSPRTQASYPVQWRVRTPTGSYTVKAVFDAQELDSRNSTGAVYWEGLCELWDSEQRLAGRGYLEMTGYAAPLVL
jgi:predicted secreted hydrolase